MFKDTPGVVRLAEARKFKLEPELVLGPERACDEVDLLVYVHDVSNRYVREAIDKRILRLLVLFHNVPTVLILNKIGENFNGL